MRGFVPRCLLAAALSLACAGPVSAQIIYQTGLASAVGGTLTSPTILTDLTVNTGAQQTFRVCNNPSATTYQFVSINGDCTNTGARGLMGGASGDANLYFANPTSGGYVFRVAGATVLAVSSAGLINNGGVAITTYDQSFLLSTAALNKTDTTFATVTGLTYALAAGKSYNCKGHLTVTAAPAAGGIKVALATTDTLTVTSMSATATNMNAAVVNARTTATALGSAIGAATATATDIDIDAGIVVNAAGTLAVQAAQNAASGTTTVGPNSTFSCKRVN